MMDNFFQIIRQIPLSETSSLIGHLKDETPFLDVHGFSLLLHNRKAFEPHYNTILKGVVTTYILRDKLPPFNLVFFHCACIQFQHFSFIN